MTDRVCVVGAGSSGIAACKVLHERGLPFDAFEVGSGIGGNWRYENDNGMSSAYRSLHINTSKDKMAYSDFPMPASYPNFPHHSQILAYFEDYVDHFGFREAIRFRTEVVHVEPQPEGGFAVTTRDLDTGETTSRRYGAVLVANGHHWKPRHPDFSGTFAGETLHSHDYRTPDVLAGRRVLVVGVGNSGVDIAAEAVRHADAVFLSTRRGAHIVPKYVLGRPLDAWASPLSTRLPFRLQQMVFHALLRIQRGHQDTYGFPTPRHRFGQAHPTVSSEILDHVAHGRLTVKPDVARLDGPTVHFADGTTEAVDLLVTATGYQIAFPFLDDAVMNPEGNRVALYKHVVHPDVPGLYFIGLVQPLGAIMPLAEVQSEWVADLLGGAGGLPDRPAMQADIARMLRAMRERYQASARHTIQVDFHPYRRAVERERRRSRRRPANRALGASPVGVNQTTAA